MIDLEFIGRVAVVRLNRPARRNAIGTEMTRLLAQALHDLSETKTVGAVVLTGAAPGFCAGSDLKELAALDLDEICRHEAETAAVCQNLAGFAKPVVAAVEGFAIGGGFALAAAADLIVSARSARWHLPEVPLGWIAPWGLPALVRRMGWTRARLVAWGAEPIDGSEAHRIGLVDAVTEAGDAERTALAMARRLAELPAEAVAATKAFFDRMAPYGDPVALDAAALAMFKDNCRSEAARSTFAGWRPNGSVV